MNKENKPVLRLISGSKATLNQLEKLPEKLHAGRRLG
jgi:hypothetical protein